MAISLHYSIQPRIILAAKIANRKLFTNLNGGIIPSSPSFRYYFNIAIANRQRHRR